MIHYRTIWDSNKNYGGYINREASAIQDPNDWIVIMDGDTMFLTKRWGAQIEAVIARNDNHFQVIGTKLSRCNVKDQLINGQICNNFDLLIHHIMADTIWESFTTEIRPTQGPVAAACMMFQKKTWEANRFQENTVHFDSLFVHKVRANGGRIGIAQGLYLAHLYRPFSADPARDYKHLL